MSRAHNTHNEFIAPYHDASKKLLIFSFENYYIENDGTREGFYKSLNTAVEDKNYDRILKIMDQLAPYRIRTNIQTARRQTRVVDSVTREKMT